MFKKNKILVTGAAGFVGANLVRRLVGQKHKVHAIIRKSSDRWRIKDIQPKINIHLLDLIERDKLNKLVKKIKPEVIFHLAAAGAFGGVESSRKRLVESNILGTINLIDACSEIDYQCFVNTGSSSEYGNKKRPMKESDNCQPFNFYGISKLAATLSSGLAAKNQKRPLITFRLFSPFGPFDDYQRLITCAVVNALRNRDLKLAEPNGVRDYIFIDEVIDLYLKAVNKANNAQGEIFNIGSGRQRSVGEMVNKIIKLTNSKSKIIWGSQMVRPWDIKKWQADIKKTKYFFHWQPGSIDQGLKKTINWFKKNLNLYHYDKQK